MVNLLHIKSLQKRLILLLMLPATLILLAGGVAGFYYARKVLLSEWREKAVLQLERAAHRIDMRLGRPMEYIEMFNRSGLIEEGQYSRQWIILQLEAIEGVSRVEFHTVESSTRVDRSRMSRGAGRVDRHTPGHRNMPFHRGVFSKVTPPRHDTTLGMETVSLVSLLLDERERTVGRLEAVVRFDYLIADIISLGWWQSHVAGVVDDTGYYLVHTEIADRPHERLGETSDTVELRVRGLLGETSGTVLGAGHTPETVAGFYRLQQVPWTVVMFASGDKILGPITRFRNYFFAGWTVFSILLLVVIRANAVHIVSPIRTLSQSAEAVSRGEYGPTIKSRSEDEIGQLIENYNRMVEGLKERDLISSTFGRYVDPKVARKLLSRQEFSSIGGTKREVVVLISDIREFTSLTQDLEPDAVIRMLNHYFSMMIATGHRNDGIIVDFIGDGLLVFFEPLDEAITETACRAFRCASEMMTQMTDLNAVLHQESLPEIGVGIGLNAGEVVVGNIGSYQRTKYGIVGNEVNLTQRIQAQANANEIVVSESLLRLLDCRFRIVRKFDAEVKGVSTPLRLYGVGSL
ncbi:Adenylate cyclase (EC [Olavius algarvensis associated proteobacterium Delta 3]|nr:Adenylate cyclase (EC [Olavius algarvensis associated proteobacterium Delta 3]